MSSEQQTPTEIEREFRAARFTPETVRAALDHRLDAELPAQWVMDQNDMTTDRRDNLVKMIMTIQRDMFFAGVLYQRNKFKDALGL